MRRPVIAANWKMNKTISESVSVAEEIVKLVAGTSGRDIIIAPVFCALSAVAEVVRGTNVFLSSQNVFWEDGGAYTGEISPLMLKDAGCTYVIIGHSERRQYFHETDEMVNKKISAALRASLNPIVCVGESLSEREAGSTFDVVERQVSKGLEGFSRDEIGKMIVAYEPVWAIGTGKTATPDQANEVHAFIRKTIGYLHDEETAEQIRIQYGGSVKAENISDLMSMDDIDGALVGGASLEAESFSQIVNFT